MKLVFDHNSEAFSIDLIPVGKSYRVTLEDKTADIEVLQSEEGHLELLLDGRRVTARVSSDRARRWVTVAGQTFVLTRSSGARRGGHGHAHTAGELLAPMPGQIRAVNVSEGETVTRGQTLLVLEAMKMEIRVQAPADGIVKKLFVNQGQTVEREQILVEIEMN
jgi:acetyl/propionyl-CoA carboxylase alpha subunit